ncbi:hypothetical protein UA08_05251 [Talaromyces atroroseus]|uniref:alpha-1,2-Mannosidase n=1 Tax=Talaromyces atroroseus TaxID=1441469 RepID=A0A225AFK3_TALAT|nr:hypothetical protein UA08_05251 [Talaromyces atroroseus]OKL59380.1 hypothetical protein UA08_05251 [Talaromyces atroroseus]
MNLARNRRFSFVTVLLVLASLFYLYNTSIFTQRTDATPYINEPFNDDNDNDGPPDPESQASVPRPDDNYFWAQLPQRYPVQATKSVPSPLPNSIPAIQHRFPQEKSSDRGIRKTRLDAVKGNFSHAWAGYKNYAWMSDEVKPISGQGHNPFGGWAATLVDTLDTLWIMDMRDDFEEAVRAIENLNFTTCSLEDINVFETTIRYLGGFLGAYDISAGKYPVLLRKAIEVGQMLYAAFDTPNRMPITRWNFNNGINNVPQEAGDNVLVAEIGSLTLEFTRLSQLTNDDRWFDAIQRIMDAFEAQQELTKVPGLWPVVVNAKTMNFHEFSGFTIGGMADSLYEYLPKQHVLLGGGSQQYQKMYAGSIEAMKSHIFFRSMTDDGQYVLHPGDVSWDENSQPKIEPKIQHLSCFAGGMVALGAQAFGRPEELTVARRLTDGCIWGYESGRLGIMPEIMHTVPCEDESDCPWDEERWRHGVEGAFPDEESAEATIEARHLPPGVSKIDDARYILRPEAIESVFILYRITGDPVLLEKAWNMFNNIIQHTVTDIAHAGINDCTVDKPSKQDRMESFWLAETLKYFYLIFSEPDIVSLDEYVLNTEAHPLRWRA